jgi:hypothetical protein
MENRIVDYSGQRARLTTLAKKTGRLDFSLREHEGEVNT